MLVIDLLLFALITLLNAPIFTSLKIHEILGIIFLFPFFVHLLSSWKWITQRIRRFLHASTRADRMYFLLNFLLFVFCILGIVSGMIISQFLLPYTGITTINDSTWRALHNQASVGIVFVASIHIAVNWRRIVSYFKKRIENRRKTRRVFLFSVLLKRVLLMLVAGLMIALGSFLVLGKPSNGRLYAGDDIGRLKHSLAHGSIQYAGIIIAFLLTIFIVRKILEIKV